MKARTSTTPHDAVFKQFLCHPETARDFLEIHLPSSLRSLCDLRTLTLESGSFIEKDLRASYSDVLWSLKTTKGEGYIYIVIEHQSSPDRHMAFRLMRYAMSAMQRHLDAGYNRLPLVVPMLFYHGLESPYPYPLSWLEEFDDPVQASRLYMGSFPLVDITVIPDDDIMQHRRIALLELIQKHIRKRDLMELIDRLGALMVTGCANDTQLKSLFNYMMRFGDAAEFSHFIRQIAERCSTPHKERLMTIAERLRLEAKHQEALRIAQSMIAEGFDRECVLRLTGLSDAELVAKNKPAA